MKTSNATCAALPAGGAGGGPVQTCQCFRPGGLSLTEHALDLCDLPPNALALDAGCGAGGTLALLQKHGHSALGVDVSLAALKTAREEGSGLAVAQSAAEQLPFADGALDAIFAECVLSVFADAARALREFARILRMGGWLVASDIYARGTEENIIAQMEACGFSVTTFEDHTPALKRFAAQLIWENFPLPVRAAEGGQMSGLFCALPPKPGYYLLVAQRSGAILDFGAGARQRLAPALHVQTHGDQT